eukprot:14746014-Alexandrium_andersonii.AAC.1
MKRLRNTNVNDPWYLEHVVAERRKWHPETPSAPMTTPTSLDQPGAASALLVSPKPERSGEQASEQSTAGSRATDA